jgi:hypothetical protein
MQQLRERRLTNTPRDIPQVPGNCGLSLNKEETLSVAGLKTSLNNPDAVLTGLGMFQDRFFLSVIKNISSLLERAKTLLIERRIGLSYPCLKAGVSET